MIRRPPRSTRTETLFPYTTLFRSRAAKQEDREMAEILVIHGLGMNMRGKVKQDVFGAMTLPEYDASIRAAAEELGLSPEIFQSNAEGEIVDKLYEAAGRGVAGAVINPAGLSVGSRAWRAASGQVGTPGV